MRSFAGVSWLILLGLMLSGCSANWHLRKAMQKDPDIFATKIDSFVSQKVRFEDTTIYYKQFKKLVIKSDTLKIAQKVETEKDYPKVYAHSKDGIAHATAEIKDGILTVEAWAAKDTILTLQGEIQAKNKIIDNLRSVTKESTAIVTKKVTPWYVWIIIGVLVAVIIFILLFGINLKKPLLRIVGSIQQD